MNKHESLEAVHTHTHTHTHTQYIYGNVWKLPMQGWNPSTRQREHNFRELSFVCDAKKSSQIIKIDKNNNKDRLSNSRKKNKITLLYDSLSFL